MYHFGVGGLASKREDGRKQFFFGIGAILLVSFFTHTKS